MLNLARKGIRELRRRLRQLGRRGALECPVCRDRFDAYADHRARRAAVCPECGALERHRLSWLFMREHTPLFTQRTRLLHFAPEAVLRRQLEGRANIDYTPVRYDPEHLAESEDIQHLSFPDASFDLIYCSHVLEHVPDDRRAMRELLRVLAPGGMALILVPQRDTEKTYEDWAITTPEGRARAFGQADHLRWYGRDIVERLEQAGFAVRIVHQHEAYTPEQQRRYGLTSEPIFVCTRA